MSLISLRNVSLSFGAAPLLEDAHLQIERGERVCIIGRNGAGKSTLMKLLAGELQADSGEISMQRDLRVSRLGQEIPADSAGAVFDMVAGGLAASSDALLRYHRAVADMAGGGDERQAEVLERAQHDLEQNGGWDIARRVEAALSRLDIDADGVFERLSGGQKRRALLARALVTEPDLLLLDEPTNHLDLDSTLWLEDFLTSFPGSLMFVTHDRSFLRRLATRIVYLDRGQLSSWPGDYDNFVRRREERQKAEDQKNREFDRKLAAEETWVRQGIKARRTRNEGRVRSLEAMREQRYLRREASGVGGIGLNQAAQSGKRVIEAEAIAFHYGDRVLFEDFSTDIVRGDKVGILGPNGAGKTTLIRVLLGELEPSAGTLKLGTRLQIAYFDQFRAALDETRSVLDTVSQGASTIQVNGVPRHVISYLRDFLFEPDRIRTPVSALSGGERNRLLLARLFAAESNFLVLDEPTNDLDLETLEVLEQRLVDYEGTLLLVSHDRAFLDNVVTSTIVFEAPPLLREYVGGYADWLRQRPAAPAVSPTPEPKIRPKPARGARLSYRDERELALLPGKIEGLEAQQAALHEALADPSLYRQQETRIAPLREELETVEAALADCYQRWEQLESMRG